MVVKKAVIDWLSWGEGGRTEPPSGPDYSAPARFPSHAENFWVEAFDLIVHRIELLGGPERWLSDVHFRIEDAPHEWLTDGAEFELYEGRRCVARGRIE